MIRRAELLPDCDMGGRDGLRHAEVTRRRVDGPSVNPNHQRRIRT